MADNEKPKAAKPAAAAGGKGDAKQAAQAKGGKGERRAKSSSKEGQAPASPRPKDYKPRMKVLYEQTVRAAMKEKFAYANAMQIPRIEKIVLNMGVGEAVNDRKKVDNAAGDLALIAGQKPVIA